MTKQATGTMPTAPLVPVEEWKELIGDKNHSLGLTTHRVIRIVQDDVHTESEVIFLDKIESVRYSRHIEWGYLGAAVVFGLGFGGAALYVAGETRGSSPVPGVLGIIAVLLFLGFLIMFLRSRKAKITICAGSESIEMTSEYKNVNQFLDFIQKVQAAVVERSPGPKAKS